MTSTTGHADTAESQRTTNGRRAGLVLFCTVTICALKLVVHCADGCDSSNIRALERKSVVRPGEVRFIHMKIDPVDFGRASDIWARFDANGKPLQIRVDLPETADGPKTMIWQADDLTVWFRNENTAGVFHLPERLDQFRSCTGDIDPGLLLRTLYAQYARSQIATQMIWPCPSGSSCFTASYRKFPNHHDIYTVNAAAQIVTQVEMYETWNATERFCGRIEYLDYNKTGMDGVFDTPGPHGIRLIDANSRQEALADGSFSSATLDERITAEFLEALRAGTNLGLSRRCRP